MKSKNNITGKVILARGRIALAFLLLCLCYLIYRLVILQIIDADTNRNAAINQYTSEITIYAKRGNIYDRNMKLLATSSTVQTIFISPKDIKDDEQAQLIADGLSELLGVDKEFILTKTEKKNSKYQIIKRNVEEEEELKVRKFIEDYNLAEQVCLEESTKRKYPYTTLASQLIGFVGADNNGLNGIELTYDSILSGINGRVIQGQDGLGNELPFPFESYIDAEDGTGLVLTIDYTIQSILEKYLKECVEENKPTFGARGIIMDPNTGEILAMACIDSYDLNNYNVLTGTYLEKYDAFVGTEEEKAAYKVTLLYEMWKNKCVTELYEPGSTFKIITTAIGLEEGVFTLDSHYTCTGSIKVLGETIHCHSGKVHGVQTVAEALQNSCNPALVQMGLDIGGALFSQYFEAFGYTEPTGSDIIGEGQSIYYSDLSNQLNLANNAFGQSMAITMLQHIMATSAIANGGYVITPHIIKGYVSGGNTVTESTEYTKKRQVISQKVADDVLGVLVNSTKNASVSGYNISSKTGTSQKLARPNAEEGVAYYISSCVSFAPAEDPQLAILIVVDEPTGGIYYGSQVAAPVIAHILSEVLPYLEINSNDENTIKTYKVEDYKNSETEKAKFAIEKAGFNCVINGSGSTVLDQLPRVGTTITEGGTIILYTEPNHIVDSVKMKDLSSMSPEQIFNWAKSNNLNLSVEGIFNKN
ncbi:MAG: penicillin-binding transpeptidase domain-containing protein, partial [Eubacteriales bacterium]|nr:penicillin-binding transpeptidase domain-containing protein [Eubacteriales bacterium]